MPEHSLREESFFFVPVDAICRRPAVTCPPGTGLVEMASLMKSHNLSGVVVAEGELAVGIVSLRDLRDLLAAGIGELSSLTARDVMKTGLITIRSTDHLFKAFFLMAKHDIHRLVVTGEGDRLVGVLTETDLLRLQTSSPLYLVQEIESATGIESLSLMGRKVVDTLRYAVRANADAPSLIELISHFNDAITQRVIFLLEQREGIRLPAGAAYLALGSEGRREQTLRTDQDSAIVYRDDLPPDSLAQVHLFAERLVSALEAVGVPRCSGNTMACNPAWCRTLSQWKQTVEQWIAQPEPAAMVQFGMFQDLRVVHGDPWYEGELQRYICECAGRHSLVFPKMACDLLRFKPPIGFFGRLLVEKRGAQRGKLDLKRGGLFQLSRGVALLALEAGIMGGTTWEKLERLHTRNLISDRDVGTLRDSFDTLISMRLERQLAAISSGREAGDHVDPLVLTDRDRDRLRSALRGVGHMLQILKTRYQVDLVVKR